MKIPLKTAWLSAFLTLLPLMAFGEGEKWIFLPYAPLFQPLIGDPREPICSIIGYTDQSRYEVTVGATAEFLRYVPCDRTIWACGALGSGIILLDRTGSAFPMRTADWYVGLYVSETSGPFSSRIELQHKSSHLGDDLQGIQTPNIYIGENFNITESFTPWEDVRVAGQLGYWIAGLPPEKNFFQALEVEIFSPAVNLAGTYSRAYATVHFGWKDEAEGVFNQSFQLGLQWKFKKEEARDLRLALIYYKGNSQFGQFYLSPDEHLGIGVFFDP